MKLPQHITTLIACQILTGTCLALTPLTENFNAKTLNKSRWMLENSGKGKLAQSGGKVNYTVAASPSSDDFAILEPKNNQPGYNESWEAILDVTNKSGQGSRVGTGIAITNAADETDFASIEFYGNGGFVTIGVTNDQDNPQDDIVANPNVTKGSLKISFDKTTKHFTFWYDSTGSTDGFTWNKLATFSTTGKGGDRRGNWNMNPASGRFKIWLFGFSERRSVAAGKVSFDNFKLRAVR